MADPKRYFGYNPPFFGGHQNVLSKQSGDRIIKNDLQQLILTNLGERVMRPEWGGNINRILFEPMTFGIVSLLESSINNTIRVIIQRVFRW